MTPAPVNVQFEHSLQLYRIREIHFTHAYLSKHEEKEDNSFHTGI